MRRNTFVLCSAIVLSVFMNHCGQSSSPAAPDMAAVTQETGDAVLTGSITASGSNSLDFNQIIVGVKNTGLQTRPDQNGDFRLNNLPLGDIFIEVEVKSSVSELELEQVRSREEIQARIEINDNNAARWCHLERHRNSQGLLALEIHPQNWNTDWENSPHEVQAKISGDGFDTIDPESVIIIGPNGTITHTDFNYEIGGTFFKAFFSQQQAIALLVNPQRGDSVEIQVTGTNDAGNFDLSDIISVVGKKAEEDTEELSVKIKPDKWNTNWTNSKGHVTVQVRGDGFLDILPETVRMSYGLNEIIPVKYAFAGNHFAAEFAKKDAIGLFTDPKRGDTYEIIISGEITGLGPKSGTYVIEIEGKK
ncbi:MAG: hypothetical protein JXB23_03885 [Candidatus Aminicenantes bacterium]|nr:hypothetical protein [Candidatus Aminicenantes bacterium]